MMEQALKILKELTSKSYKAYIVGGFVRDYLLGIESNDIDITTNATPKEIKEIFNDNCLPNDDYGSVVVLKNGVHFEITTFRKEFDYVDNRRPLEVKYVNDLYTDLLRRDFVINTLCMDDNGKIIDYLGGQIDLEKRIIRCVGDSYVKFSEDSLRILRAIRFATILDFELSSDIVDSIKRTKHLINDLSYFRKKSELDKIFSSSNRDKGIQMILDFGLEKELNIPKLKAVLNCGANSSLVIWSMLDVSEEYPFNKNELELMNDINEVMNLNNLDPMVLYKYGLYINSCAGSIKGLDLKKITESYNNLVIKSRDDVNIDSNDIMNLLNKEPGKYIKDIFEDIEREILYRRLVNDKSEISSYILNKYSEGVLL